MNWRFHLWLSKGVDVWAYLDIESTITGVDGLA